MGDCLPSSLLCSENNDSICYNDNGSFLKNLETEYSVSEFPMLSEECLCLLIDKECEQFVGFDYLMKLRNGKLDFLARQQAIDWILKKDKDWMMQLLAVACLSLASKMDENEVPLILDLQVCESRYVFEANTIQKMELLVLTTLKWRMQIVTPFSFIDALFGKLDCDQNVSRSLILRSTQLILCLVNGIDYLEFRPSEIAAGVAISVVGQTQMSSLFQHVEKGRILKCVELVNQLNSGCSKSIKSGTMPRSPIGVLEVACLSYTKSDDSGVESTTSKRRLNNATPSPLEL